MAFSLEAALVVPLTLVTCAALLSMARPACRQAGQEAVLEARAVCFSLNDPGLYRTQTFVNSSRSVTALRVSPQNVLEICSLARDDLRIAGRIIGSAFAADSAPSSGDRP